MYIDGETILEGLSNNTNVMINVGSAAAVGMILNINGEKFFGKGYLRAAIDNDNCTDVLGVHYESLVYDHVIPELTQISPNFVPGINTVLITDGATPVTKNVYDKLIKYLLKKSSCALIDPERKGINLIISKYIPNTVTLHQIKKDFLSTRDIQTIVSQVVISLIFMEKFQLAHNDLHIGNILLEELPEETMIVYNLPHDSHNSHNSHNSRDSNIRISGVKYKVYIFDWDLAYSPDIGINQKLSVEFFSKLGIKNQYDNRFDLFTFLCTLREKIGDANYLSFLDEISPDFLDVYNQIRKVGFSCRLQNPDLVDFAFTLSQNDLLQQVLDTRYLQNVIS